LTDDAVRVVAATHAAVVARERARDIIAFILQIKAQDRAAHVDIGLDVGELVATHSQALRPEGHHLHEPDGACRRDGVAVEAALDRHQTHDETRRQASLARPVRFAIDDPEHVYALSLARHEFAQLGLHHLVPDGRIVAIGETFGLRDRPLDDGAQFRIALLIGMRHAGAERGGERSASGADASE